MPFEEPPFIYVATVILFLLPCSLLFFALIGLKRQERLAALPRWRKYLAITALLTAGVSTFVHLVWNFSWLRSGGSPHGMGAGPGLWQSLGRILLWTWIMAALLGLFGKGRVRGLLLGWFVSMYFVFQMIYLLQFD
jgi:hypothetical protein